MDYFKFDQAISHFKQASLMMYFHQKNSTDRILPGGQVLSVEFKILPGNQPLQTGTLMMYFHQKNSTGRILPGG